MSTLKRKLGSRKLWAAAAVIAAGLAMVFGLDESIISTVSGAVTAVASVVAYILTEGKIDSTAVKNAVDSVNNAVEAVQGRSVDAIGFDVPCDEGYADDGK